VVIWSSMGQINVLERVNEVKADDSKLETNTVIGCDRSSRSS
jgi:hypothetical protein